MKTKRRTESLRRSRAGSPSVRAGTAAAQLLGQCARADLLLALDRGQRHGAAAARLLGFEPAPSDASKKQTRGRGGASKGTTDGAGGPTGEAPELPPTLAHTPAVPARFWQPVTFASRDQGAQDRPERGEPVSRAPIAAHPPESPPLAPWQELRTRLQPHLSERREGKAVDTDRLVRWIGAGRRIERIPRRRHRRRRASLVVLVDRSDHLAPYWSDQEQLILRLARDSAPGTLEIRPIHEARDAPGFAGASGRLPPPGSLLLVLGDLGCLRGPDRVRDGRWLAYARALRQGGIVPLALLPCAPDRCPKSLRAAWQASPWEHPPRVGPRFEAAGEEAPLERLLVLLSVAVRLEPGLVRATRHLLAGGRRDAGLESDLWQHPAILSTHSDAASWDPTRATQLRARFEDELARVLRRRANGQRDAQGISDYERVLELLKSWRGHLPREIWFEELLSLVPATRALEPVREDAPLAERFFLQLSASVRRGGGGTYGAGARDWYRRCRRRLSDQAYSGPLAEALHRLTALWDPEDPDFIHKPGYDPLYASVGAAEGQDLRLVQAGSRLLAQDVGVGAPSGSPLGRLRSANRELRIAPMSAPEDRESFWDGGQAPTWAHDWGWDGYGAWVAFAVEGKGARRVVQRMRWIGPGGFPMGSPEDEPERWNGEGPQHEVRIDEGFWLFDTACTQGLWEAVMGENPARFEGDKRPVEQVSWDDAQGFIAKLNERLPGLGLRLPSEAQWEYACRSGTETPFSFGADITPEEVNYYGDYPYAGGGKGEYRGETVPTGSLPPNPWGLYEMHGNVWEWAQDTWHASYEGAPVDGSAWESGDRGADRVIRGGSWDDGARYCRCAVRGRGGPGFRSHDLGFRCARAQVGEQEQGQAGRSGASGPGAARPAERVGPGGAGSARAAAPAGTAAEVLHVDSTEPAAAKLVPAPAIEIESVRERLVLRRACRPKWARAMGRDRFGLWADMAIEGAGRPPVVQRLRWIPPGRFIMGSPDDEPGRREAEGPRHEVALASGYWLFDTPCTQELWEAVIGGSPSEFRTPDRSVEGVSWDDTQDFLARLNERLADQIGPGEGAGRFILPSEAQWEYACRAGADTALYTGPIEILGAANAPALDAIAWYGGNSSVDFELPNGRKRSWLREMQYPEGNAGTHPVKGKLPNPWGLHDMLGNVYEWVQDSWHDNYEGAPVDGSAWESVDPGAARVIRGGSLDSEARFCRCAYRSRRGPGGRGHNLGFRCARAQV
jgi:formylglycine-generating enzyme required for sulfatase activity